MSSRVSAARGSRQSIRKSFPRSSTMRTRLLCLLAVSALFLGVSARAAWGQDKGNPQEEAALLKCANKFVDAFHKGDAKALAAHWTPHGDSTDPPGKTLKGREAIEQAFSGL